MKLLQNTSNSTLTPLPGDKSVSTKLIRVVKLLIKISLIRQKSTKKVFRIVRQQKKGGVIGGGRGQEEDGEGLDDEEDEIAELEQRLRAAKLPEHALKAAKKELKVL
jgi:hypothetical protein